MTNEDFRSSRERLGMTQVQLAAVLDVPLRTLESWEQDQATGSSRKPNRIACRVLEWIEQGKLKL
mgnify:CR=1 FL=1